MRHTILIDLPNQAWKFKIWLAWHEFQLPRAIGHALSSTTVEEETANTESISQMLLGLLVELGVKDIFSFSTCSEAVSRKMIILIDDAIKR